MCQDFKNYNGNMLISEQIYSLPLILVIKEVQMMLYLPSQQEITHRKNT